MSEMWRPDEVDPAVADQPDGVAHGRGQLTDRQRHRRGRPDLRQPVPVLGRQHVLEEEQPVRLEGPGQQHRFLRRQPRVDVVQQFDVVRQRLPRRGEQLRRRPEVVPGGPAVPVRRVRVQRGEPGCAVPAAARRRDLQPDVAPALRDELLRLLEGLLDVDAAGVDVGVGGGPDLAAEQFVAPASRRACRRCPTAPGRCRRSRCSSPGRRASSRRTRPAGRGRRCRPGSGRPAAGPGARRRTSAPPSTAG